MNRPLRLSRRTARRLLDGRPAAHAREQRLARLLGALGGQDAPRDTAVPAQLLEAFTRQAQEAATSAASPGGGRTGSARSGARSTSRMRSRRIGRALTVKAAFVLAFSGATVAATAADALPAPAQSAVHDLLGSWGVPAPSAAGGRTHATADSPGRPGAPVHSPASSAAAPPPVPAGRGRPAPHATGSQAAGSRPAGSHPATPTAGCPSFPGLRNHGLAPDTAAPGALGTGNAAAPGCASDSDGVHTGPVGGRSADAVTGGEPAKDAFGGRPAFEPGHRRTHGRRRANSEH